MIEETLFTRLSTFAGLTALIGTVKMAPQPFMRPAFDVSSQQALSVITNKLDQGIQKEAAKLGKS